MKPWKYFGLWCCTFAFLGGVVGFGVGAVVVTRQADALVEAAQQQSRDSSTALHGQVQELEGALINASNAAKLCLNEATAHSEENTVIYERSPMINVHITGIHGFPIIPLPSSGVNLPRVMIAGKVKPLILAADGDTRGAVYYYVNSANRLDGPYLPEVVRAQ